MNLHGLVSPAIGVVNPPENVILKTSNGYTTNRDGSRVPKYNPDQTVPAQIQPLSGEDLKQVAGLNLQGNFVKMYFFGTVAAIIRKNSKGGDLIVRSDGTSWLTTQAQEQWSTDWCSVICTEQAD